MRCKACDKLLSIRNKTDLCNGCREVSVQTLREIEHDEYEFTEYMGRRMMDPPDGDIMGELFTTHFNRRG